MEGFWVSRGYQSLENYENYEKGYFNDLLGLQLTELAVQYLAVPFIEFFFIIFFVNRENFSFVCLVATKILQTVGNYEKGHWSDRWACSSAYSPPNLVPSGPSLNFEFYFFEKLKKIKGFWAPRVEATKALRLLE